MRILGVSGSLKEGSGNFVLLETAAARAPVGVEVVIFDGIRNLPPFSPDLESPDTPAAVTLWKQAVAESDALLVASPEYGFSLPGVLKNAIDWIIGSGELERKVVAITAAVNHRERGRRGLEALAHTLRAVSARVVAGQPIARGPTFDADVVAVLDAIVLEVTTPEEEPAHGLGVAIRPAALVREWVVAFNQADADRLATFYAADATNHQVAEAPVQGRDAIRGMFADGFAHARMVCVVENVFEDGEWAMLEWRDPKGLRGCGFFQVKKGLIVFQRGYWDRLTFLRQQGLPLPRV
ncbi:MAG TPA: NAD(P)H-dependent oxidoreductase [Polyangiaceae bacterium]|nr:NAD(P)H-dependent oxidoreductase [Polyangiaceae bacterium]